MGDFCLDNLVNLIQGEEKWNINDKQGDNCDQFGHYARDCRAAKRDKQYSNSKKNSTNEANINVKEKETFAFTTNENYRKREIKWLLDSGATNHMSWDEK